MFVNNLKKKIFFDGANANVIQFKLKMNLAIFSFNFPISQPSQNPNSIDVVSPYLTKQTRPIITGFRFVYPMT